MTTLIIYNSVHHKNTEKVAKVLAKEFKAELKKPEDINFENLEIYDLIGFGSGIYMGKFHKSILELVEKLPKIEGKKAFVFSTSGNTTGVPAKKHHVLKEKLKVKGFNVVADFNCPGWDTFGPFKLFGGLNKGRPNEKDLLEAEKFAKNLMNSLKI